MTTREYVDKKKKEIIELFNDATEPMALALTIEELFGCYCYENPELEKGRKRMNDEDDPLEAYLRNAGRL